MSGQNIMRDQYGMSVQNGICDQNSIRNPKNLPLIFDIQRFSLDNGPGIRTTVFIKSCPLSCVWCHNPESKRSGPEIAFYPHLCLGCGDCKKNCPQDAISLKDTGRIIRKKCTVCGFHEHPSSPILQTLPKTCPK